MLMAVAYRFNPKTRKFEECYFYNREKAEIFCEQCKRIFNEDWSVKKWLFEVECEP